MTNVSSNILQQVAHELYDNDLLTFGTFTLKSGLVSPFYIDLRQVQSYPSVLRAVTRAYGELLDHTDKDTRIAGVPEAGTPLATAVGYEYHRRLVQPRKVVKDHGTKRSVEGAFDAGDSVILIDDLITKGDSKVEAIQQVESAGLKVQELLVLIDREQGGINTVREAGYNIRAAMTITTLLGILRADGVIPEEQYRTIIDFVRNN